MTYRDLYAALARIRSQEGQVCDEFEICAHPGCQSSYAAWAIADQALRLAEVPDRRSAGA